MLLIEVCGKSLKGLCWTGGKDELERKVQWAGEGWQCRLVENEYVISPFRAGRQPLRAVWICLLEEKRKVRWR